VKQQHWRIDNSWIPVERPSTSDREFTLSFSDEVALDFPAVAERVERMRHAFVESEAVVHRLSAEIRLSVRQAGAGAAVPLELALRSTCRQCGGRGEVWGDACDSCQGSGHGCHRRVVMVSVPPGVAHGTRFAFSVSPPTGPRTRVEVCVAIT
jgi:hypothetical protein